MNFNLRALVVILSALALWLGAALVRVENERYALFLGMCRASDGLLVDASCLAKVETRTSWVWHLMYALKG